MARVMPVLQNKLCQPIDMSRRFGDQDAVGPCGYRRFQGSKSCVTPKHAEKYRLAVRTGRGADASNKLRRPADGRLESNAVIGPMHIVVHGLGNTPDGNAFRCQYRSIAQGIVAPYDKQSIEFEKLQILQHFVRQINAIIGSVPGTVCCEIWGEITSPHACGIGTRGLQYRPSLPIDGARVESIQRQDIIAIPGIGVIRVENKVIQAARTVKKGNPFPSLTNPRNTNAERLCTIYKRLDSSIQPRYVSTAGQYTKCAYPAG